jgi:hypothetical protein
MDGTAVEASLRFNARNQAAFQGKLSYKVSASDDTTAREIKSAMYAVNISQNKSKMSFLPPVDDLEIKFCDVDELRNGAASFHLIYNIEIYEE